jgi:single-strand DNA-binding protein
MSFGGSIMVNRVTLLGYVGREPELKYTPKNTAVVSLSVATTESWGSGDDRQQKTSWHKVVAWGKLAEIVHQYVHKGSQVYVEGRLDYRTWEAKEGGKRTSTEIVASVIRSIGGKGSKEQPIEGPGEETPF